MELSLSSLRPHPAAAPHAHTTRATQRQLLHAPTAPLSIPEPPAGRGTATPAVTPPPVQVITVPAVHGLYMSWRRSSGSIATLPCLAPTNGAVYGLRYQAIPQRSAAEPLPHPASQLPRLAPVAAPQRAPLCASSCGSPRMLGDVPLLLSEQRLYGIGGGSVASTEAGERRTRGSSAGMDALERSTSEDEMVSSGGGVHKRCESFGADSKLGFEAGAAVFMDWDSDAD